jgi:hypothetical protein
VGRPPAAGLLPQCRHPANLDALQSVIKAPLDVKQYGDLSLVQDAAKRLK